MPTIKYHPDAIPLYDINDISALTIELNEEQLSKCYDVITTKRKNKELKEICKTLGCGVRGEDGLINKAGMILNIVIKYILNENDCMSINKRPRRLLWEWISDINCINEMAGIFQANGAEWTPTTITE